MESLKFHGLPLVSDHQLPVGPFHHLHLKTGVAGPSLPRQKLQLLPPLIHRVAPGHLAGVPDATLSVRDRSSGTGQ